MIHDLLRFIGAWKSQIYACVSHLLQILHAKIWDMLAPCRYFQLFVFECLTYYIPTT